MFKRKSPDGPAMGGLRHLYHAVTIEPGPGACSAVRQVAGARYLSEEAPRLPLDACPCVQDCRCVYRHYPDRRTDVRRDADLGLPHRHVPGDQRVGAGRRITDA